MTGPSYQVWLRDIASDALHLDLTDWLIEMEWSRVACEVGSFSIVLPEAFPQSYLNLDSHLDWRVEIWRRADDYHPLHLENIGLIRRATMQTDEEGRTAYVASGPDLMHLLTRRISIPNEQAQLGNWNVLGNYAADMMREAVRKNLVTSAVTSLGEGGNAITFSRNLPTTCGWTFSVEADTDTGDEFTDSTGSEGRPYRCAGQKVLDTLQGIYQWSREPDKNRDFLYFHIDFDDYKTWTFRVHPNRIGVDHSSDSGQPVFIGLDYGNLQIPVLDYDRSDEWTVAIVAESGNSRYIEWGSQDTTRKGHSVLNHIERYEFHDVDAYNRTTALLAKGKRKKLFTGRLVFGPGSAYGREWGFGDEVTISFLGQQYNAHVIGIRATLDNTGREEMQVMLDLPDQV